jgi:hypothetical protein
LIQQYMLMAESRAESSALGLQFPSGAAVPWKKSLKQSIGWRLTNPLMQPEQR